MAIERALVEHRATGFLATGFLATGFLATGFLATGFLATGFLATGFLATTLRRSAATSGGRLQPRAPRSLDGCLLFAAPLLRVLPGCKTWLPRSVHVLGRGGCSAIMKTPIMVIVVPVAGCGPSAKDVRRAREATYTCSPQQVFDAMVLEVKERHLQIAEVDAASGTVVSVYRWHISTGAPKQKGAVVVGAGDVSIAIIAALQAARGARRHPWQPVVRPIARRAVPSEVRRAAALEPGAVRRKGPPVTWP